MFRFTLIRHVKILILSRIWIYRMERDEIMSEIPKKAKDLVSGLNIDLDILRKKS